MADRDINPSPNPQASHALSPHTPDGNPAMTAIPAEGKVWKLALTAGLVAGLVAWAIGEMTYQGSTWNDAAPIKVAYKAELSKLGPYAQTDFITKKMYAQRNSMESRLTALEFGILGGVLGLALGIAGGMAGRTGRPGLSAGLLGLILAGGAAALMSYVVVPLYYQFLNPESGLEIPLLSHGGILVLLAAASGLALGLGLGGDQTVLRSILGAISGAIIAAVVFELVVALAFSQEAEPSLIPPERSARAVLCLTSALLVAGFAAFAVVGTKPRRKRTAS